MDLSNSIKTYWNQKYAQSEFRSELLPETALVGAKEELLARHGRALDIACGEGRNAVFLGKLGFQVEGVDISFIGLQKAKKLAALKGVRLDLWVADLTVYPLPTNRYNLVLNLNFLLRELVKPIDRALKRGGLLIFQTHTQEDYKFTRARNAHPEYYLASQELLSFFPDYRIWYSYEGPLGNRHVATLIAEKP